MQKAYKDQFKAVTIPVKTRGLEGFVAWYRLVVRGAFNSGIASGY